jgi:hypothetical protein
MPAAPKLLPALLGGLFIGVLSSLPIVSMGNLCCCLWVVSGGVLAAWVMQQNTPRPVTNGEGALVGVMAGCIGGVLVLLGLVTLLALSRAPIDFNQVLREAAQSPEMTPEGREALENLNPVVLLAFIGMVMFVVYAVMATLGGLLGATIFRKKLLTGAPSSGGTIPGAGSAPGSYAPPAPPEPYGGDAPTMLIPSRGPTLPQPPVPPAPPSGATPPQPPSTPPDREPGSH